MTIRFVVDKKIPFPARTALSIVQAKMGLQKKEAEALIHAGAVTCSGRVVAMSHYRMKVGDFVEIATPRLIRTNEPLVSKPARFEILHEDDDIVVVIKPAGMLSVPTKRHENNSLQQQLLRHLSRKKSARNLIVVQRLDREVSGVMVLAKHEQAAECLREEFSQRKPQREYVAILHGGLGKDSGTIRSNLATDDHLNRYSTEQGGELAITHYETIEKLPGFTVVSVKLETGRRNQIRVHFAEQGHPLLGDARYSKHASLGGSRVWPYKRIALHAASLGFVHPTQRRMVSFTAPWPKEFGTFIKSRRSQ
jgi:23S rRNA pseudouridine1911/1915/1917 synthase